MPAIPSLTDVSGCENTFNRQPAISGETGHPIAYPRFDCAQNSIFDEFGEYRRITVTDASCLRCEDQWLTFSATETQTRGEFR